jgi:dCMP deaminase
MPFALGITPRDRKFMALAVELAKIFSKDPRQKVGAIGLGRNPRQLAIGYNGLPQGIADDHRLQDRDWKNQQVLHAEMNVLLNAQFPVHTIYATHFPCIRCAVHLIGAGLRRVVAPAPSGAYAANWQASVEMAVESFREAGVEMCWFEPREGTP